MALVKLTIDGRRIIADNTQSILDVARDNGIDGIPTLCFDGQLEPFSSCFVCVVKVKGARTLVPACATKVAAGMEVETDNAEVRKSRKAALELLLSNHYADCIGPCRIACPAEIDIQGYIALAALGKYEDAIRLIKQTNPLPAICGRVCTRPCEVKGCRRGMLDEAVGIDYIKRYIADLELGRTIDEKPVRPVCNGRKVAVVGAGPAGLSCAYYLALAGFAVTIFEAMPEAGGMLRYGIPEYRLPKEILDLEVNQILDLGVTLKTNVRLGTDFTVTSLKEQDGFEAVFLGLGAWDASEMRVQNEKAKGVLPGIGFLEQFGMRRPMDVTGRVVVVGGGNTAIDCARTALRVGASEVTLLYRRTRAEMPANEIEIEEAEHEGVKMTFLAAPVKVIENNGRVSGVECIRMELGEPDASGRRSPRPVRGSEHVVPCDFVISAIGQATKVSELVDGRIPHFLPHGEMLTLTRWKTIQVQDGTNETSVEGVFSGGDVVTGAATAIEAIAAGRKAAHAIEAYLREGRAKPEPKEFISRKDSFRKVTLDDLTDRTPLARRPMPVISLEDRKASFTEVETGYTPLDIKLEAKRCLECGCDALFDCDLRRYATEYDVEVKNFAGEATSYEIDRTHPLIALDPNKCILCGRCVRICADIVGIAAYGFINRGFSTIVRPALGGSLLETDCVSCGLCLGTCPTGAIAQSTHLDKPGPFRTTRTTTVCHYCGVGCRLDFEHYGDTLVRTNRPEHAPVTHGNYCRKGRFGFRFVQDGARLAKARVRSGREQQPVALDEALTTAAQRVKELARRYSGREVAVFVSPRLSNEEAYLAQKLARVALKTHNVGSFAALANDTLDCPDVVSTASYQDLLDAQAIVCVNAAPADDHFVADLMIKKAIRKGTRLIVLGGPANRTTEVAEVHVPCTPGLESRLAAALGAAVAPDTGIFAALGDPATAAAAAGADPERFAAACAALGRTVLRAVVFNKDHRGPRLAGDERTFAALADALGAPLLALREKANRQGLADMGVDPRWLPGYRPLGDVAAREALEKEWCVSLADLEAAPADLRGRLARKEIKVALIFGEDPLGSDDLPADLRAGEAVEYLVVADAVDTATAHAADVVLPLSTTAETGGTFTNLERRVQRFARAVSPAGGIETWQLFGQFAARMGLRFKLKYDAVEQVTEEIRRVVPIYRSVVVDNPDVEGVWDLSAFPLTRGAEPGAAAEPLAPVPTLALDALESRFARWFDRTIEDARRLVTP